MIFRRALVYIVLHLFASVFAALVVVLMTPVESANQILISFPSPNSQAETHQIFILEFIFSFMYVAMYFGLILNKKAPSNVFGFGIGGVILVAHLTIGTISGGCVNPVRFFGPALLTDESKYMTVYLSS